MLLELVRSAAAAAPDQPVVVREDGEVTYARCLARAEALARGLRERGIERFACVAADAAEVVALAAASSAVGSEACIHPARLDPAAREELLSAFDHRIVVTDGSVASDVAEVIPVDELAVEGGDLPPAPGRAPVMILTTGTTGRPKGALHDWGRLVRAASHTDPRSGTRWLLAYNLNQFAGVQILLHVLTSRATLVVPPSNRPRDAIGALRELGVTHASATPTFWRLAVAALDDDEHDDIGLQQITLGGEAVPAGLVEELGRRFPGARISQVYASTEFGSAASVRDGRHGLPVSLLERGDDHRVQLRIVDGELHVRSEVGMVAYYGEEPVEDGWRPTGDLVEVRGDRIHFVGRVSDVINVGGVKVHPLPIEERVAAVDGIAMVRAYGRANPITGNIVVVDVVPREGVDPDVLTRRVREACSTLGPAAQPRRINVVPELEVRQHKIVRGKAVE